MSGVLFQHNLFTFIKRGLIIVLLVFSLFNSFSLTVKANAAFQDCSEQTRLNISNLFRPAEFIPVVPESCSGGDNTKATPLSIGSVGVVVIRAYGLVSSLVFYLFFVYILFAGIRWSYAAFNESEAGKAKQSLQEAGISISLVLLAHLIVSTIFTSIFKFDSFETDPTVFTDFFS